MTSDHKRQFDQSNTNDDASKARRGVERIDQLLRRESQQGSTDGKEQGLPYTEIFQQSYDQIPRAERDKLRASEQSQITEVSVADLPDPEGFQGPQDFDHHITYEDAKLHTHQLNEVVLPWVRAGAVGEDFKALDHALGQKQESGLNQNGYYETYRLFYGNEPIIVGRAADHGLDITGGRHRIYMAKELGLTSLPVRQSRTSQ